MGPSLEQVAEARRDPKVFADLLVGMPLWSHQAEVVDSRARYRVICAGRRSGKTRLFGVLSLHQAFSVPGSRVLIVSAGEVAAKRMFSDIAGMAQRSPMLRGSIADETKSLLTLSTGSSIECVPASEAQIRSAEADLLIVDEAGYVPQAIWEAAEPVVLARPGSRVLICSTPRGTTDHFFRTLWRQGMDAPTERLASWHWPSTVSPLVDEELLADIRSRSTAEYYEREYLAQWGEASGSYFTDEEITSAVGDTPATLVDPAVAWKLGPVAGGVDWGFANDANTLVVVAAVRDEEVDGRPVFAVVYVEEQFKTPYSAWIDRLVALTSVPAPGRPWYLSPAPGFVWSVIVAETNGVGQMPTQVLHSRMTGIGLDVVAPVSTTSKLKETTFGYVKLLLQQGRLRLPNHPALLKQLRSLAFEELPTGGVRLTVPEALGHDDVAMALSMAIQGVMAVDVVDERPRIVTLEDLDLGDDVDDYEISPW